MDKSDIVTRYNYDAFVEGKFETYMSFDASPTLGEPAPDFPLWRLEDRAETSLAAIWSTHVYTVVEFGSFT